MRIKIDEQFPPKPQLPVEVRMANQFKVFAAAEKAVASALEAAQKAQDLLLARQNHMVAAQATYDALCKEHAATRMSTASQVTHNDKFSISKAEFFKTIEAIKAEVRQGKVLGELPTTAHVRQVANHEEGGAAMQAFAETAIISMEKLLGNLLDPVSTTRKNWAVSQGCIKFQKT